ncbi:universal stress protein [Variovorax rhizosphaerae]|uniref:Universal stress protein n=1 Tax=Variovorax rhizosphaerae TaxID=1836200 RepID=A0ABU8WTE8_9BURK
MYERILVPIDGSNTSLHGLDEALRLAGLTHGRLLLVHIVDQLKYLNGYESAAVYMSDLLPHMQEAGEQILRQGLERAQRAGIQAETLLLTGLTERVADVVVGQANAWKADLIVIGTHGRHGLGRVLLGSDAEQILRVSPVPVLLVRSKHVASAAKAEPALAADDVLPRVSIAA